MDHPTTPPHAHTLEELGKAVAQLRYDAMILFLRAFIRELARQQHRDEEKGHRQLAFWGMLLVRTLEGATEIVMKMLKISYRHMAPSFLNDPLCVPFDIEQP